jgi:hypothetical protein
MISVTGLSGRNAIAADVLSGLRGCGDSPPPPTSERWNWRTRRGSGLSGLGEIVGERRSGRWIRRTRTRWSEMSLPGSRLGQWYLLFAVRRRFERGWRML